VKKIFIFFIAMLFGSGLFVINATAIPIDGEIHFGGAFTPTGGSPLSSATEIDFLFTFVTASDGAFTGLDGTPATFNTLDFSSPFTPVTPLWSVASFSFDLESVAVISQSEFLLALSGTGTLHAGGFDDTPGSWRFSGDRGNVIFTFSSNSVSVPDANIMLLLGSALIGLGVFSKKFKRS
jgi:hypothetical protein